MTPPLRVLLAAQPLHSGVAHHVLYLVDGLDRDRYELHVACPRSSVTWAHLEKRADVHLHEIAPDREPSPADIGSLARLVRVAAAVDVIHAHSSKAGFLARLASAVRGRRRACLFTPHGWSFWSASGSRARVYTSLERLAARWCRVIVTLSSSERAAGLAAGVGRPEQYRVIPNAVDVARFTATPQPVPGRILWVGRFAAPKRPDLALRALKVARERAPHAELHLVGDGVDRPELERLAGELRLGEAVRFLGTRDDVAALLTTAACVVLASDYEGCPLSVIEAMAARVPVVATAVGGVSELVEDGRSGVLTPAGDAEALGTALAVVLTDPARARAHGEAGRVAVEERFSLEVMVDRLAALYDEAATRRATPRFGDGPSPV